MNADCKGALAQLDISWKAFHHQGKKLSKEQVKAVLEYAIEKGYDHTGLLTDQEVDDVLFQLSKNRFADNSQPPKPNTSPTSTNTK